MNRSRLSFAIIWVSVVAAWPTHVTAQPACPDSINISIEATLVTPYTYQLEAGSNESSLDVLSYFWQCSYPGVWGSGNITNCYLPGAGNYLVTADCVVDLDGENSCLATGSLFLQVPPDTSACGGQVIDFTITYDAGTFTFVPLIGGITSSTPTLLWDFGDAYGAAEQQPQHSYYADGHYEVCLTVVDGECEKTHCKWLYFGSGDVQCTDVLIPASSVLVVGNTVAFIDESVTSGMFHHTTWNLGNGLSVEGPVAVYTYTNSLPGESICAEIQVWGPLLEDTCSAQACVGPFVGATGIENASAEEAIVLYPVPFRDHLVVKGDGLFAGDRWSLLDLTGREVLHGNIDTSRLTTIAMGTVPPGAYVFALSGRTAVFQRTVIKE